MRGPSPFTQGQRELIAAYVSGLNACTYCHGTHLGVAEACGVAPDVDHGIARRHRDWRHLSRGMQPILHYARKLTL